MKTKQSPELVDHFLRELEHPSKTLTSWELDFLISIRDQFDRGGTLSEGQFKKLSELYEIKTA